MQGLIVVPILDYKGGHSGKFKVINQPIKT